MIWDTTKPGQAGPAAAWPSIPARDFRAEAVIVVSNKATTLRLVDDLERRGIPAFGPIWDS